MKLLIVGCLAGVATAVLGLIFALLLLPVAPTPSQGGSRALQPSPVASASARIGPLTSPTSTSSPTDSGAAVGIDTDQLAPDFALRSLDGKTAHPVWINFWASWCPLCRGEMPRLEGVLLGHEADGLVVLAIALKDAPPDARAFVKQVGVTRPIVLGEPGKVADRHGAVAVAVLYWVDRDGTVRGWAFGELPLGQCDASLAKTMASPSPTP